MAGLPPIPAGAKPPVAMHCPKCKAHFNVRGARPGQVYPCPKCKAGLEIDALSARTVVSTASQARSKALSTPHPGPSRSGGIPAPSQVPLQISERGLDEQAQPREIPVRLGRYFIDREIARGGMGVVYLGRQEGLERVVAIKMMLPGALSSPEMIARFKREAKAAGRLKHPNIVAVHENGDYNGQPFFTMDFVEGKSLESVMEEGPMDITIAVSMMKDVSDAIHYAHQQGIVHRDLKPANILLDEEGRPRITDFGLAKDVSANTILSMSGDVMGTPAFMSPEQAAGKVDEVGPRSDLYSLGAILYKAVTGKPVFDGANLTNILMAVVNDEPLHPTVHRRNLDPDLCAVIMKAIEKRPEDRYETVEHFAEDLEHVLNDDPVTARPVSPWKRFKRKLQKNRIAVRVAGVAAVLIVVAVVGVRLASKQKRANLALETIDQADSAGKREALKGLGESLLTSKTYDREERKDLVARMLKALKSPDEKEVSGALPFFANIFREKDPELHDLAFPAAVEPLIPLAGKDRPLAIRKLALDALGASRDPKALDAIHNQFNDPDPEVRIAAIRATMRMPSRASFKPLLMMSMNDPPCRAEAKAALEHLNGQVAWAPFSPGSGAMQESLTRLSEKIAANQEQLEEAIDNSNDGGLKEKKNRTLEALKALSPQDRFKAAYDLRDAKYKGDRDVFMALWETIDDPDKDVAYVAAQSLAEFDLTDMPKGIVKRLKLAQTSSARGGLCFLAGKLKIAEAVDPMIAALGAENDPMTIRRIAQAMAPLKEPSTIPALVDAMERVPEEAQSISAVLADITGKALGPDPKKWREWMAQKN